MLSSSDCIEIVDCGASPSEDVSIEWLFDNNSVYTSSVHTEGTREMYTLSDNCTILFSTAERGRVLGLIGAHSDRLLNVTCVLSKGTNKDGFSLLAGSSCSSTHSYIKAIRQYCLPEDSTETDSDIEGDLYDDYLDTDYITHDPATISIRPSEKIKYATTLEHGRDDDYESNRTGNSLYTTFVISVSFVLFVSVLPLVYLLLQ